MSMISTVPVAENYLPVPINTLIADQGPGVELYIRESDEAPLRLYCTQGNLFDAHARQKLLERGVRTLFIPKSAHQEYQGYLRANLSTLLADEGQSVRARFAVLSEVVRDVVSTSFRAEDVDATVKQGNQLAEHSVTLLQRDDYATSELLGVLHHDYSTFTHSANVSFLSVMLAGEMGITDAATLREISVGGLLHDLGKLEVPDRILTKPGKLTDGEYEVVRDHARWGYRKLCKRPEITFGQLMMVYQHHERIEGGGYPVGCRGHELHEWARICTVIDVFEALTANRPYRSRLPIREVVEIMLRGSGKVFDAEILECWLAHIKNK